VSSLDEIFNPLLSLIQKASFDARGKSIAKRKTRNPNLPSSKWVSDSRIGSDMGKSLAIVLNTIGCSHARSDIGGCTMCSYLLDGSNVIISSDQLQNQFDEAFRSLSDKDGPLAVKLYTSGSFLDSEEVPDEARQHILTRIADDDRIREVIIESRPEYVTESRMNELRSMLADRHIELGIGIESMNDKIRTICINKGFSTDDFIHAVDVAKAERIGVRAYVLLKPPFLTERDALTDAKRTINEVVEIGATTVSINPINIQKDTLVEFLWNRGVYRPPWLWSIVDLLLETRVSVSDDINIICDPVAAGKSRGSHNCGVCDGEIIQGIKKFSMNQDIRILSSLSCQCKETWKHVLSHEDVTLQTHRDLIIDY